MIPTQLTLSNFMCYRGGSSEEEAPTLNLDGLHVVCLSGENGAGKSALLEAITWALWGEARVPDDELIAQGESEMLVQLDFQLGEQLYRVRRQRQRGGTGKRGGQTAGKSTLDLQIRHGDGWRPLSELQLRETQARIDDLLRMSYQTFINASFLLQGRADEFTARTPAERKQVLADILDLSEYAALEARAKERARTLDDQLKGLHGRIEQLEQDAAKFDFWQLEVSNAAMRVDAAEGRVGTVEQEHAVADERRRVLEGLSEPRKELLRRLATLRDEQARRDEELVGLRSRIGADEALVARRPQIELGLAQLAAAESEQERLDQLAERFNSLEDERKELQAQLREALHLVKSQLTSVSQRRDDLQAQAEQRAKLSSELERLRATLDTLAPLERERAHCAAELQGVEQHLSQLGALQLRHNELDGKIKLRHDSLVGAREEKNRSLRRLDEQLLVEPRLQRELAEAEEERRLLADDEARLSQLRGEEQTALERVSALRAECARLKEAAEKLKSNQALLSDGAGNCPVCHSDLGAHGVERVHAHYAEELSALRGQYAAAKREADNGQTGLGELRGALGDLEARLGERRRLAARAESLAEQLAQAARLRVERDELQFVLRDLQTQLADGVEPALQAERAALGEQIVALGDPTELRQQRGMLAERGRELDNRLKERDRASGALAAHEQRLAELEKALVELPTLQREAAELERQFNENDYAHEVRRAGKRITGELEVLGYSRDGHKAAREQAQALRRWQDNERELLVAEQRLSGQRTILAQAEALSAKAAEELVRLAADEARLALELRALPEAQQRAQTLLAQLSVARRELAAAQNDRAEKLAYLRQAETAAGDLQAARFEENQLLKRHGLFAELAEAYGKKGVQAMLIETAIPQIEDEANRLLGRMTDNQMHLSFEMQRDTKKGDTVETLEIKIADALGTRVYDAFSGGEAMRANFAVRIALSRLLARRAGARLETLIIDEGFGTLDGPGRERMVEAITGVQDDFKRIIVITHIDELKERFPAQIEITKTAHGSQWQLR